MARYRNVHCLDFRHKSSRFLRRAVFQRDRFTCQRCGWKPPMNEGEYDGRYAIYASGRRLDVDHVVPRHHGGTSSLANLQALCNPCNSSKRDTNDT